MERPPDPDGHDEAFWREFLTHGDPTERRVRGLLKRIPAGPRCSLCAAPFQGVTAPLMRMLGKRPSDRNPSWCTTCFTFMAEHHGGAEIECSFLFADIRGSTTIAEGMSATAFRALLDRFYGVASTVVFAHDGSVDKFVGDELVAAFFPLLAGPRHTAAAIAAGEALLRATGHADPDGPWVPLGAGVHTGLAWVGAVGDAQHTELSALGDTVNTTARLAAAAAAGEILVSVEAARIAGRDVDRAPRALDLKGKTLPTEVVSIRVDA